MRLTRKSVLQFQAAYYIGSGLWPLVSMSSFEAVTGKKTDRWLVQTVGLLVTCVGASLAAGAAEDDIPFATTLLAIASALALAGIDVVHSARRRISPIYLSDAALELALVAALCGTRS